MLKLIICCTLISFTIAGIIHDHHQSAPAQYQQEYQHDGGSHGGLPSETELHHNIEHEHATSHQSFKMHHFHAVPVYVKKEDQHFLKHPIEISGVKHNLKVLHPETQHNHGHGLILENHTEEHNNKLVDHYGGGGGGGGGGGSDGIHHHEAIIHHEQPSYAHYEAASSGAGAGEHGQESGYHGGHGGGGGGGDADFKQAISQHQFHDINVHHGQHHE